MRKTQRNKWVAGSLAAVLLASSALWGCGGQSDTTATTTAAADTTAATTTAAADTTAAAAAPGESDTSPAETEEAAGSGTADSASLESLRGNENPTDEEIELANTTYDDSYLTDQYDIGSDYSAYPYKDDTTLTVWFPDTYQASIMWDGGMNEHYMVKKIEELTGIHVEFTVPPAGDESTSFNLMLSGGELPDIIINSQGFYPGGLQAELDDGLIISLNDYAEYLPNYMHYLDSDEARRKESITDDGTMLALFEQRLEYPAVPWAMRVKKIALEKTGWTAPPETVDEWYDFLTDCKEAGFTVPLVFGAERGGFVLNGVGFLATAYGTSSGMAVKDGKVYYGPMEDGITDYLKTMKQWYEEGLIDPDYLSGDWNHRQSMITSDECAVIYSDAEGVEAKGVEYVTASWPVLNKGDQPEMTFHSSLTDQNNSAVITSSCKNIEAALAYLDFGYTKKGWELYNFGTYGDCHLVNDEGIPYFQEDSLLNTDPDILERGGQTRNSKYKILRYIKVHDQNHAVVTSEQSLNDGKKILNETLCIGLPNVALTSEESAEAAKISSDVNNIVAEYAGGIVVGTMPIDAVAEMQQKLKDAGIERYVEMYQAAYDRYLQR